MTQQSSCGTCGRAVVWGRRADRNDKFCPPFDATTAHTGSFISEDDGVAHQVTVYQLHRCEPDDVTAWADILEARRAASEASVIRKKVIPEPDPVPNLDVETPDDIEFDLTKYLYYPGGGWNAGAPGTNCLEYACSECETEPGDPCWNMSVLKRGQKRAIKSPHQERVFCAGLDQHYRKGLFVDHYEAVAKRLGIDPQELLEEITINKAIQNKGE